jgi:predicted nucleotidyltransferase
MLATVEAIVERLVTTYDPDRIILFGSRATGDGRPGSDVDLLIVKQTGLRPVDRRIEVERLLADRTIALDLVVYTPEEIRRLFAAGSPFIEEVIEHGRVLYMRKATAAEGVAPREGNAAPPGVRHRRHDDRLDAQTAYPASDRGYTAITMPS